MSSFGLPPTSKYSKRPSSFLPSLPVLPSNRLLPSRTKSLKSGWVASRTRCEWDSMSRRARDKYGWTSPISHQLLPLLLAASSSPREPTIKMTMFRGGHLSKPSWSTPRSLWSFVSSSNGILVKCFCKSTQTLIIPSSSIVACDLSAGGPFSSSTSSYDQ